MSAAAQLRKRFTRDDVDHMAKLGLFEGQRLELLDGDLLEKMGQNPPHADAIPLLLKLLAAIFDLLRIRIQSPMEIAVEDRKYNLPEPDLLVRAGHKFVRGKRHPRGDETILVIEIADTSLGNDLTIKRDLYARAGVPEYLVLNVKGRKLIVHSNPKRGAYTATTTLSSRDSVSLSGQSIRVADMLP